MQFANDATEDIWDGIRINDRYRVCFRWNDEGCTEVEIVDYH